MSQTYPALTVWQPWATLIAEGAKPYEFRSYAAPRKLWGRRIAIHAAARPIKRLEVQDLLVRCREDSAHRQALDVDIAIPILRRALGLPSLPTSSVVALVTLGTPIPPERVKEMLANDSDRDGHFNWAWPMLDIERIEPPLPATGAQGFWTWRRPDE
jgi:hypothetical protein